MPRRRMRDYGKRYWRSAAGKPAAEDEELTTRPPNPDAVARRAAVLVAVLTRGFLEADTELEDPADTLADQLAFYDRLELAKDAEPEEDELVRAPHGTLPDQAAVNATWRTEGLAVLVWALGLIDELPPFDTAIEPDDIVGTLGLPWAGDTEVPVVRSPHLRPASHFHRLDAQLLTAHWRVRQFQQIDPAPMDYVEYVPGVEWASLTLDGLETADNDLAIDGLPITEADPERVGLASSILLERRLAISWLLGYDESYSAGDTNT